MILAKVLDWNIEIPKLEAFVNEPLTFSHLFHIDFADKLSIWRIGCCFKFDKKGEEEQVDPEEPSYMAMFLKHVAGQVSYEVKGEFSIFHNQSKKILYGPFSFAPTIAYSNQTGFSIGYESMNCFSEIDKLVPKFADGTVHLVHFNIKIHCNENDAGNKANPNSSIDPTFEMMLKYPSDVTVRTSDGHSLDANSQILKEKSKIMEKVKMRRRCSIGLIFEQQPASRMIAGTIIDVNCNFKTMVELLRFMYLGTIKDSEVQICSNEILLASKNYEIEGLTDYCIKVITKNLNESNVLKMIQIANSNNIPDLFVKCCNYIQSFYDSMCINNDWKNLSNGLKYKILDQLAKAACSKKIETIKTFLSCKRSYSSMIDGINVDGKWH